VHAKNNSKNVIKVYMYLFITVQGTKINLNYFYFNEQNIHLFVFLIEFQLYSFVAAFDLLIRYIYFFTQMMYDRVFIWK